MTIPPAAPTTASPVSVRVFDRPDHDDEPDGEPLSLRLDRVRVWCDARELHIVQEHQADGPYDYLDVLGQTAEQCRDGGRGTPLVVWDVPRAVGDHVAVWRLLRVLGEAVLVDACRDHRLMLADHGLILPVPTPWPILRWKPRLASTGVGSPVIGGVS
jgi:hypothetical protein